MTPIIILGSILLIGLIVALALFARKCYDEAEKAKEEAARLESNNGDLKIDNERLREYALALEEKLDESAEIMDHYRETLQIYVNENKYLKNEVKVQQEYIEHMESAPEVEIDYVPAYQLN